MYFLKRLIAVIPLVILISLFAFCLVRIAPGGPFDKDRAYASPAVERNLRAKYHLDEPLWKQYGRYLGGLVQGDFGPSLKYRSHSVTDIIAQGLPVTLTLGGFAFVLALGLGVPLGFWAAVRDGARDSRMAEFLALLAVCVPNFVVGPILVMIFSIKLQWLPVALWESPMHMILPVITLALYYAGRVARLVKEGMSEVLNSGFIVTARAKGLRESVVLVKHALKTAVLPVVSYSGPMLANLLTGSFVVENIFQVPGIGVFLVNGSMNRDYTLVVGLVVLYAVLLLVLNLVADLIYALLDPRVRYE
ncbi:MAG: ABC transporter permease [Verrucomicrobia bacterium]|nr:ABC transporter permease [Verrucomicrobiota bacterium]